jgi:anti-sigma B factor antagonist
MQISERKVGPVTVIDLSGRMTTADNPGRLKEKVTSLVFQGEKQIVLNLANLTYCDSSGLGELVACHGTAVRGGGAVKLANTGKRLQDLLVMTKLLTVFESFDTEDAALASFSAAGA